MKNRLNKEKQISGASLVVVLWLIGLLGFLILGLAKFVSLDSQWAIAVRKEAIARDRAESGLAIASHPQVKEDDPLLVFANESGTSGFEVQITWEEGLVPLNNILISGRKDILKRLFESWGQHPDAAAALVDALTDWVDQDDLVSLNGAESDSYAQQGVAGFPLNRPFESFGEVEWVLGMGEIANLKPDWREYFTFWSNGQIDLNEANAEVVYAAMGGIDPVRAFEFVQQRNGQDGIPRTPDDRRFDSVASVRSFLGAASEADNGILAVRSTTKRIYSVGYFQNMRVEIAETRRSDLLLWRMEY